MSNRSNSSGGVGVAGLLGVAFVVLKLTGVINWSWWLVTRPFWIGLAVVLGIGAIALVAWLITMAVKRLRKMRLRHGASTSLVLALLLTGCAGGMFGTGVGDGDVSDGEAAVLNIGGSVYGVADAGAKAQKVLGSPAKAEVRQYRLLGEVTSMWDSVGTIIIPPVYYRIDPDFGPITGVYGQAKAPASPASGIDPALQAVIQQAVQQAIGAQSAGHPISFGQGAQFLMASGTTAGASQPATGPGALP